MPKCPMRHAFGKLRIRGGEAQASKSPPLADRVRRWEERVQRRLAQRSERAAWGTL